MAVESAGQIHLSHTEVRLSRNLLIFDFFSMEFYSFRELPDDSPFITADESHETSLKKLKLDIEIENKPKENGESSMEMNGNAEESEASTCDISLGNSSISQADRTKVAPLTMFHLRPRRGVDL